MITALLIRLLTGAQARWAGCDPSLRQRIYFANHVSNFDGPVIWASLPPTVRRRTRLIAARDYWTGGPVRRFFARRVFNALLINRKRVTRDDNPLDDMAAALGAGSSLIIFPEGRRQDDEDAGMNPFKAGIYRLGRDHPEVELVPVYLANLNRILPRGEYLYLPLMSSVTFGAPIAVAEGESRDDFLARARDAVAALAEDAGEAVPS